MATVQSQINNRDHRMMTFRRKYGTDIYYKGAGQPVVFSHGLPLRRRVRGSGAVSGIAWPSLHCPDRCCRGRSSQPCNGHEFNTLAGDLAELVIPHSDARQIVQIATSALLSSKIVKSATLCGTCTTLKEGVNEELVAFCRP
jgi:hypothetical protein